MELMVDREPQADLSGYGVWKRVDGVNYTGNGTGERKSAQHARLVPPGAIVTGPGRLEGFVYPVMVSQNGEAGVPHSERNNGHTLDSLPSKGEVVTLYQAQVAHEFAAD